MPVRVWMGGGGVEGAARNRAHLAGRATSGTRARRLRRHAKVIAAVVWAVVMSKVAIAHWLWTAAAPTSDPAAGAGRPVADPPSPADPLKEARAEVDTMWPPVAPKRVDPGADEKFDREIPPGPGPAETSSTLEIWRLAGERRSICRVTGACRLPGGALVLPRAFEPFHEWFHHCGLSGVRFEEAMPALRKIEVDLVTKQGFRGAREHIAHFAQDVLAWILPIEVASGNLAFQTAPRYRCVGRCQGSPLDRSRNRAAWLVPSGLVPRAKPWLASLLANLQGTGRVQLLDEDSLDADGGACFRSVVAHDNGPLTVRERSFRDGQLFFEAAGASRSARSPVGADGVCRPNVVVLSRAKDRRLMEDRELCRELERRGRVAPLLAANVTVRYFEQASYEEQVATMRAADLVVAAHGAAEANILFMRPRSAVLEIFPFAYDAKLFRDIARVMDVDWVDYPARPAPAEAIAACAGPDVDRRDVVAWWEAQAALYHPSNRTMPSRPPFKLPSGCVRGHPMSVDVAFVTRVVLSRLARVCESAGL